MDLSPEQIREQLLSRRQALLADGEQSAAARAAVELDQTSVGRLSRMDAMQGQAMAQAQQRRRDQELQRIASALQRIADGDYGCCLRCGDEISQARLTFDPAVTLCIDCAQLKERKPQ